MQDAAEIGFPLPNSRKGVTRKKVGTEKGAAPLPSFLRVKLPCSLSRTVLMPPTPTGKQQAETEQMHRQDGAVKSAQAQPFGGTEPEMVQGKGIGCVGRTLFEQMVPAGMIY